MFKGLKINNKDLKDNVLVSFGLCELETALLDNEAIAEIVTKIGYVSGTGGWECNVYLLKINKAGYLITDGYRTYKAKKDKDTFLGILKENKKDAKALKEALKSFINKEQNV